MGSTNVTEAHAGLTGKWRGILEAEGVSPKVMNGRHQPCPVCEGRDRFRFDDKGIGRFYCSQCGPGDGFKLLMLLNGVSFPEAKSIAMEHAGVIEADQPKVERDTASKRQSLIKAWRGGNRNALGLQEYFTSRAIPIAYADDVCLKWHPNLPWMVFDEDNNRRTGSNPALLARYFQWDGKGKMTPVTIHRIWPSGCPKKKMVMPPILDFEGIFCPVGGTSTVMGICEGLESALSYRSMSGITTWSVYSAEEMKKFNPPRGIQQLHIGVDIDYSYTGQAAGYELARRLRSSRPEIETKIVRPTAEDGLDWDFNDQLRKLSSG
jgi:putative DNA primase/helicase